MSESTTRPTEQQLQALKESMTYVALVGKGVGEGCQKEARRLLYLLATRRFGQPGIHTVTAVEAICETEQLEAVCLRIVDPDVCTWDDLFRGIYPGKDEPHGGAYEPDAPASESMVAEA
jgi:hypothetical protein